MAVTNLKIKNCPFCGSEAVLVKGITSYAVACTNRNCMANALFTGRETDALGAVMAWNARLPKTGLPHLGASYEASENTESRIPTHYRCCPFCGNMNLNFRSFLGQENIACADCGADVGFYGSPREAIDCWNERAEAKNGIQD